MVDVEISEEGAIFICLVDFYKILYECSGIEYYLDYILFNPIVSNIPKWRNFKFLRVWKFWTD
jgi:hypothetical protein